MSKIISPQVEFASLLHQTKSITPEIFTADGNGFFNLLEDRWQEPGKPREFLSLTHRCHPARQPTHESPSY